MANYLKGIGDASQRINEILPSLDARIYNFLEGHTAGIIKSEFYEFSASTITRGVVVKSGLMQAHGYFGCTDTDTQINFVMPSTTQYCHLYAEIDLSVVPNRFEIKATALSNNTAFSARLDNLRSTTNGKYQLHLWQLTLTSSTITLTDKRVYINKPLNAVNAEQAVRLTGSIDSAVTGVQQTAKDNSNRVATTSYVEAAISDAFNITVADILTSAGVKVGTVRRQGNFVICSGSGFGGIIPEGFRPKNTVYIGVSSAWQALAYMPEQGSCSATGSVSSSGSVSISIYQYYGNYMAIACTAHEWYGGWQIT